MTIPEALYCMRTYFSDEDLCEKCPYYRSEKVEIDGTVFYKCKEQEAHKIVWEAMHSNIKSSNKKVISLGNNSSSRKETYYDTGDSRDL